MISLKNKNYKLKTTKGFSLVEILVYISIFAIVSVVVINSYIIVFGSFSQVKTNHDLVSSANSSLERISREIRQAKTVDILNSTLGATPGVLQLNSTDSIGATRIVKFYVSNGQLNLSQGSSEPLVLTGNLLGPDISVTNLIFRRILTSGTKEAIKIEMTLQDNRSKTLKNEKFYDTIILRGGY